MSHPKMRFCDAVGGIVHGILEMSFGCHFLEDVVGKHGKVVVPFEGHPKGQDEVHLAAFPGAVEAGVDDGLDEATAAQASSSRCVVVSVQVKEDLGSILVRTIQEHKVASLLGLDILEEHSIHPLVLADVVLFLKLRAGLEVWVIYLV